MGGLSEGQSTITNLKNRQCYQMTGNVTTENNGGFIQIRTPINPSIDANERVFLSKYMKTIKTTHFM